MINNLECRKTYCDICLVNCGVDAWVNDKGQLVRIEGSRECANKGRLCVKGYSLKDYVYRKDRIQTPLKRIGERGEGKFVPVTWEEAYSEIAKNLLKIKRENGPDSVAFYTGYSKWYRTIFHRFVHSFGTENYGTESSCCFHAMRMAHVLNAGCLSTPDTANSDLFLAWAFNPSYSGVYATNAIEDLQEKGLKIISIDPKVTPFSQRADLHLQIRPGTDGALALYFGNYLIAHNAIDREYIDKHVHGFDEYAEYVKKFTLHKVAEITGIEPALIKKAAKMLADNPVFSITQGAAPLVHHRNGVQNARAILALSAITGNYDREGGNIPVDFANEKINSAYSVNDQKFVDEVRPVTGQPKIGTTRFPVWGELCDEFQAMDLSRQILEGTPYPVKGLFTLGLNAKMFPGNRKLLEAIKTLDFFVDVDIFMNESAKYADIVLPACTSLERSQFQSRFVEGNTIRTTRYVRPVIAPLYESKSDVDILSELAVYLEMDDPVLTKGYDACAKYLLKNVGLVFAELKQTSAVTRIPGLEPYYPGDNTKFGYNTPTRKFELTSEILRKHGFDPLPTFKESCDDVSLQEYPLQLIAGGRLPYEFHSRFQTSALKKIFRPDAMIDISAEDAEHLNIAHGDEIRLSTSYGTLKALANVTLSVKKGQVFLYQDYETADVNSIIDPEHLDPISGFPGFRSVRCKVEKEL